MDIKFKPLLLYRNKKFNFEKKHKMKLDSYFKYQIKNILKFAIFSLIVFFIMIQFFIGNNFGIPQAVFSFLYGASVGIIFEVTNSAKFYSRPFIVRNLVRLSLLIVSILLLFIALGFFYVEILGVEKLNRPEIDLTKEFIDTLLNILIVTIFIVLFIEFERHLGNHFIWNFFISKYKKPIKEDRVIMFLDLKDSTTIAERIGSDDFVNLINLCYKVMSKSIIKNNALILKYVGDEVILTWDKKKGIKNSNCINFYFDFNNDLEKHKSEFMEKFDVLPVFKAGVHVGTVTAAFLGSIKKQMDYSGDVMNTTARIESICNKYDANILISGDLVAELDKDDKFVYTDMGAVELKGKTNITTVSKVSIKD